MAEVPETNVSQQALPPRLDMGEFDEAFRVFSKNGTAIAKENVPLFLRSIGLNRYRAEIEDKIRYRNLLELDRHHMQEVIKETMHLDEHKRIWPSHDDVIDAFAVFDQEGLGFIPVQQLKRFLLQAQLGFQDEDELEKLIRNYCRIDGDDQIKYEEFIHNICKRQEELDRTSQ